MTHNEIAARARAPYAAKILELTAERDELVAALRAVIPYAENETQGLFACARDDDAISDEAEAAESALKSAYDVLAKIDR